MRILFLGINYWPEEIGIAVFTTGRCEYLAKRGHEVTICTAFPYYPHWKVADGYDGQWFKREEHDGVTILRCRIYLPSRVTSFGRVIYEASFVASSTLRALGTRRPEVLFVTSPPLGLSLAGVILSKVWRVPLVLHVEDLQPDAALELGMLRPGRFANLLLHLERIVYRKAALVGTLNDSMRRRILGKGIPAGKVVLFPHWVDPALFEIPREGGGMAFRQSTRLQGKRLVVHAGNMGVKQGLDVVLQAAELSRNRPEIAYLLVGDGAARPGLEQNVRARNMDNVCIMPLQPRPVFHDLLAAVDLALVTQHPAASDVFFPSKLETLLAAGRPMVASANQGSAAARVLHEAAAGLCVAPGRPEALRDAIVELLDDPARRDAMGEAGRRYARTHLDPGCILPGIEEQLLAVAGRRPLPQPRREPQPAALSLDASATSAIE